MTVDIVDRGSVISIIPDGKSRLFLLPKGVTLTEKGTVLSENFSRTCQQIEVKALKDGFKVHAIRNGKSAEHKAEDKRFYCVVGEGVVIPTMDGLFLVPSVRGEKAEMNQLAY